MTRKIMTDQTSPGDFRNIRGPEDHGHIKGWGVDADTKNDPVYPMKKRTNEEHLGYSWQRPQQQAEDVEILRSVERPNLTAAFGTSTPPSGLSGMIRRMAFKYSESSLGRWVPLLLADRIGAIEGIIQDLGHGHVPNIFAERGWAAEWKYNRKGFITKVAAAAFLTGTAVALLKSRNKRRRAWMW